MSHDTQYNYMIITFYTNHFTSSFLTEKYIWALLSNCRAQVLADVEIMAPKPQIEEIAR